MPTDRMSGEQQVNQGSVDTAVTPFFAVSLLKLVVLSVGTLGLYDFYWFYQNWKFIKNREFLGISPFWRAFFAFFYCYQCFSRIRDSGAAIGIPPRIPAGALAAGWIITMLTWKLPAPYSLITNFAVFFIVPVQAYANRVNTVAAPEHNPNSRFTPWNWVGVVIGGLLFALSIVVEFIRKP